MKFRYALALLLSAFLLEKFGAEITRFVTSENWSFASDLVDLYERNAFATVLALIVATAAIAPLLSLAAFFALRVIAALPEWTKPTTWARELLATGCAPESQLLEAEAPIRNQEEDAFNFGPFAKRIAAEMLLQPNAPSMVFSIEDDWGSGKTSAINLIEQYSVNDPQRPIVIRFNPWQVENIGQLIEVFLTQLAATLARHSLWFSARRALSKDLLELQRVVAGLRELSSDVSSLIKVFQIGQRHGELFGLETKREEIQTQIDRLGRPIIVIIDDIDRLEDAGIRTVFQLVKTLCDFRRFAYLLAFDRKPVVRALKEEKALEKFVQVSYRLPRIGVTELSNWLDTKIRRILDDSSIDWKERDWSRLREGSHNIAAVLDTPREGLRTLNKTTGLLAACHTEVDPIDIVLFAGITTKYPAIEDSIRKNAFKITEGGATNPEAVTSYYAELAAMDEDERKRADEQLLERMTSSVPDPSARAQVIVVLNLMFANRFDQFSSGEAEPTRIAHINALLTLLNSGTGLYSHNDAVAFLRNDDRREEIFYEYAARGNALEWLQYVATCFQSDVKPPRPERFASQLSELTRFMWIEHRVGAVDQSSLLIRTLTEIVSESDPEQAFNVMDSLAKTDNCLSLSENAVLNELSRADLWRRGELIATEQDHKSDEIAGNSTFPKKRLLELAATWVQTVRTKAVESDFSDEPEPLSVLFRWGQLSGGDYSGPQEWTKNVCADEKSLRVLPGHLRESSASGAEKIFWNLGELIDLAEKAAVDKLIIEKLGEQADSLSSEGN